MPIAAALDALGIPVGAALLLLGIVQWRGRRLLWDLDAEKPHPREIPDSVDSEARADMHLLGAVIAMMIGATMLISGLVSMYL